MANLTKQQVIDVINNRPAGSTPEGVVAALRQKGHTLEGYATSTPEGAPLPKEKTQLSLTGKYLSFYDKSLSGLSGVAGVAKELFQVPQTLFTELFSTIPAAAGYLMEGRPDLAKQEFAESTERIKKIPSQIAGGFEKGFWSPTPQLEPSRVFSEAGIEELAPGTIGGLGVDIFGDPTLVVNVLTNSKIRQEVLENSKKAVPYLQSFGESFSNFLKKTPSEFSDEFARIGQEVKGIIQEAPEQFGKQLASYNIKGSLSEMVYQINQKLPKLKTKLNRLAEESTEVIRIQPIADSLDELAERFSKIGKTKVAQQIIDGVNILRDNAKTDKLNDLIPIEEGLAIKRALDTARQTAKGALSESKKVIENLVFKTVGDNIRDQINKIPQLGDINKEMTALIEGLEIISDVAAKRMSEGGILPVGLSRFFPFVKLKAGAFSKVKTLTGGAIIQLSKIINVSPADIEKALKTVLPSTIQNLFD